jgi:hypothetical protein
LPDEIFDTEYMTGKQPNLNRAFVSAALDTYAEAVRREEWERCYRICETVLLRDMEVHGSCMNRVLEALSPNQTP